MNQQKTSASHGQSPQPSDYPALASNPTVSCGIPASWQGKGNPRDLQKEVSAPIFADGFHRGSNQGTSNEFGLLRRGTMGSDW